MDHIILHIPPTTNENLVWDYFLTHSSLESLPDGWGTVRTQAGTCLPMRKWSLQGPSITRLKQARKAAPNPVEGTQMTASTTIIQCGLTRLHTYLTDSDSATGEIEQGWELH